MSPVSGKRFRHRCGSVVSVGAGFMIAMAAVCTDTTAATGGVGLPRRRGKSKAPNFKYEGPVSVIRLELDVTDERLRQRLERQWVAVFRLRRALQRDAAHRCPAHPRTDQAPSLDVAGPAENNQPPS
jgi:hypothetical protein